MQALPLELEWAEGPGLPLKPRIPRPLPCPLPNFGRALTDWRPKGLFQLLRGFDSLGVNVS